MLHLRISEYTINAKIRASMKDKCYNVVLTVDGEREVLNRKCQCPRGNWLCSHMAATAIYINKKGVSKTDLPISWIAKPRKQARNDSKTFADIFPSPKPQYRATSRDFTEADNNFLYGKLIELSVGGVQCHMQWMTVPEPPEQPSNPLAPLMIEDLIEEFSQDRDSFVSKAKVAKEQILWLPDQRKGQRNNALWGRYRKLRLTGIKFGDVIKAHSNPSLTFEKAKRRIFISQKRLNFMGTNARGDSHVELHGPNREYCGRVWTLTQSSSLSEWDRTRTRYHMCKFLYRCDLSHAQIDSVGSQNRYIYVGCH